MLLAPKGATDLRTTVVIGDVHGCFFTLKRLLKKIPQEAEIILAGDLCDRGNYTKEVIEWVIQGEHTAILGNHESYMLEHIQAALKGKPNRWVDEECIGGRETMSSYKGAWSTLERHLRWMSENPLYLWREPYFITHAFALPYFKRRDIPEKRHAFLVNRVRDTKEWGHDFEEGYEAYELINIFGHEVSKEVRVGKNFYGIDTGCVYGNKLSAIELGSMKLYEELTHPLDISSTSAPLVAEHLTKISQTPVHWRLEEEALLFEIGLSPKRLEGILKRLKRKNPELLEGLELQIQENPASPSLSRLLLTL